MLQPASCVKDVICSHGAAPVFAAQQADYTELYYGLFVKDHSEHRKKPTCSLCHQKVMGSLEDSSQDIRRCTLPPETQYILGMNAFWYIWK